VSAQPAGDVPQLLTREQCARAAQVHVDTITAAIVRGELKAYDLSSPSSKRRVWRIDPEHLGDWLEARTNVDQALQPSRRAPISAQIVPPPPSEDEPRVHRRRKARPSTGRLSVSPDMGRS
jgi:hypothetical protein